MDAKSMFKSKTFWVNLGALVTAVGAFFTGDVDAVTALIPAALALANLILRVVTKQPVEV